MAVARTGGKVDLPLVVLTVTEVLEKEVRTIFLIEREEVIV